LDRELQIETAKKLLEPRGYVLVRFPPNNMNREELEFQILELSLPPQEEEEAHTVFSAGHPDDNPITRAEQGLVEILYEPEYQR
jgi:hypothetical protein